MMASRLWLSINLHCLLSDEIYIFGARRSSGGSSDYSFSPPIPSSSFQLDISFGGGRTNSGCLRAVMVVRVYDCRDF